MNNLLQIFCITCVIAGLLASGASSSQERQLYIQSWNQLQQATHVGGNFYPPPWIRRRIRRGGMVYLLIRRLLNMDRNQVDNGRRGMLPFYRHILVRATDFSRFRGILWNLQAITRTHIRLDEMRAPNGCCWHHGLGCLLVTNNNQILAIGLETPPTVSVFFTYQDYIPLMGIDVAKDGTIVTVLNSNNLVILISQTGDLIARHSVMSPENHPLIHTLRHSCVIFTHDQRDILCVSNVFGLHALSITGRSHLTFGKKGSKPGEFRGPTQIVRLRRNHHYALSDSDNQRVQILEINVAAGTINVVSIVGNNFFSVPTAILSCQNCLIAMSKDEGVAYFCQGDKKIEMFGGVFEYAQSACCLPNGSFAVVRRRDGMNPASSEVIVCGEPNDWRMPPRLGQCLEESLP